MKITKFFSIFLTSFFFYTLFINNFAQANETCQSSDSFIKIAEKFDKLYFEHDNTQEAFNCLQYAVTFTDAKSEAF